MSFKARKFCNAFVVFFVCVVHATKGLASSYYNCAGIIVKFYNKAGDNVTVNYRNTLPNPGAYCRNQFVGDGGGTKKTCTLTLPPGVNPKYPYLSGYREANLGWDGANPGQPLTGHGNTPNVTAISAYSNAGAVACQFMIQSLKKAYMIYSATDKNDKVSTLKLPIVGEKNSTPPPTTFDDNPKADVLKIPSEKLGENCVDNRIWKLTKDSCGSGSCTYTLTLGHPC